MTEYYMELHGDIVKLKMGLLEIGARGLFLASPGMIEEWGEDFDNLPDGMKLSGQIRSYAALSGVLYYINQLATRDGYSLAALESPIRNMIKQIEIEFDDVAKRLKEDLDKRLERGEKDDSQFMEKS